VQCIATGRKRLSQKSSRINYFLSSCLQRLKVEHGLGILDTSKLTLLDSLECKGSDQSGTNTATILSSHDLDRVGITLALLLGPVQHLTESLSATGLEVRVLVKHRSVGTNVSSLVTLLLADSSDTTGRQTCSTSTDKLGETADQLELGLVALEVELAAHQLSGLGQVLERILLNGGKDRGVNVVRLLELVDALTLEHVLSVVHIEQDETEDLTKVQTSNHLLKGLLTRTRRLLVDLLVVLGERQNLVFVVESTVLAVNGDRELGVKVHVSQLRNGTAVLHVSSVTSGTEDTSDLHLGVGVSRGDQSTSGVVDQSSKLDGDTALGQSLLEGRNNVLTLNAVNVEALGPSLQNTVVDVVLSGRVGEGETKRKLVKLLALVVVFDELLQTIGDVAPKLVGGTGLELLGHAVLGLDDVELSLLLGQVDLTDTEVGAAHVEGEESAGLVTSGETHTPGRVHGLSIVSDLVAKICVDEC
jgi:hypothetical protein